MEEVRGGCRKLHIGQLFNFYAPEDIVGMIKSAE
jgi:hypothetical protein